jgi:UDP-N-acetyl-D-mannosaminuronic acid dehydrogenase
MTAETNFDVGVIGLGYVGLTLATVLAEVGMKVIGIERRAELVSLTKSGKSHFSERGLNEALGRVVLSGHMIASQELNSSTNCEVYIITVGTPLDLDGKARLDMIETATRQVAKNMRDGALIILRSTVKIGTTREVVAPILTASGKRFDIAMCPERTLEGLALEELRDLPQIVGADTQDVRDRAAAVFRHLTNTIVQVSSLEAAEIVKLVDNTYRDVQFAFANEVARVCEAYEVNANEVITSGKLGYKRTNVRLPGLVGGPCLEKDPHILLQSARARGVELEITRASRLVNERQPFETVDFIGVERARRGFGDDATVALLGIAFKGVPATDDMRGSMSLKVLAALTKAWPRVKIRLFDPVITATDLDLQVPGHTACATLEEAIEGAATVIIANNHPEFGQKSPIDLLGLMAPKGFIYDYWNHFSNLNARELGGSYFAVGNVKVTS